MKSAQPDVKTLKLEQLVGLNVKRQIPFQKSEIFLDIKAWDTNFFVEMITLSNDDI